METDKEELKKYLKKSSIESNLDKKEIGLELKTNFEAFEQGRFPEKLLEEVKNSDSFNSNDIMKEIEAKHTEILKGRPMPELLESAEMIESLQEIKPPAIGKLYEEKDLVQEPEPAIIMHEFDFREDCPTRVKICDLKDAFAEEQPTAVDNDAVDHKQPEAARAARSSQKQPGAAQSNQKQPGVARSSQEQPQAARSRQEQPESSQKQPETAIKKPRFPFYDSQVGKGELVGIDAERMTGSAF